MSRERPARRHLDDAFLQQRLDVEAAQRALRALAQDEALPQRLRTACAAMHQRLTAMRRELTRRAQAVQRERAAEGDAPDGPRA